MNERRHWSVRRRRARPGRAVALAPWAGAACLLVAVTPGVSAASADRDLTGPTVERASVGGGGAQAEGESYRMALSGDGRYVAATVARHFARATGG